MESAIPVCMCVTQCVCVFVTWGPLSGDADAISFISSGPKGLVWPMHASYMYMHVLGSAYCTAGNVPG